MTPKAQPQFLTVLAGFGALAVFTVAVPSMSMAGSTFEDRLSQLALLGPEAIIALRFAASLAGVMPTSPLLLAAGASEGLIWGTIYVLIGAELGALAGFLIGRRFGREFVERRGVLERVERTRLGRWLLDETTPQWQLMLAVFSCRLIPGLNMDALSYVAGLTPLSAWRFCLASFAALLPYTLLVVAAGQQLVSFGPEVAVAVVVGLLAFSAIAALLRKLWPCREATEKEAARA